MRVMSIDYGDRRIGIALSDPTGIIANGLETYVRKGPREDFTYIAQLAEKNNVDTMVIGLPINMDGTEGDRVAKSRIFGNTIGKICPQLRIEYIDERLTTVSAEKMLIDADVRRDKRKTVIDKIAATIILQSYLDKNSKL